jgi:hypothetical protein
VLSALGPATAQGFGRDPAVIEGIRHIVRAMDANGPRRLVYLSTLGVPGGRHQYSFFQRYVMAPTLLRGLIGEHDLKERIIRTSGLDWTLVRPPILTNGKRTEAYRHGSEIRGRSVIPSCSRRRCSLHASASGLPDVPSQSCRGDEVARQDTAQPPAHVRLRRGQGGWLVALLATDGNRPRGERALGDVELGVFAFDELRRLSGRHRAREQEALALVTAPLQEGGRLAAFLHTFGGNGQTQSLPQS